MEEKPNKEMCWVLAKMAFDNPDPNLNSSDLDEYIFRKVKVEAMQHGSTVDRLLGFLVHVRGWYVGFSNEWSYFEYIASHSDLCST